MVGTAGSARSIVSGSSARATRRSTRGGSRRSSTGRAGSTACSAPRPGARRWSRSRADGVRGSLFVHELSEVRPGTALDYLAAVREERAPLLAEYGHELVGLYEVMMNDYEVCTVWATTAEDHVRAAKARDLARGRGPAGGRRRGRRPLRGVARTGPYVVHPVARGADDPARRHAVRARGRTPRRQRVGRRPALSRRGWKCIKLSPPRPRSGGAPWT